MSTKTRRGMPQKRIPQPPTGADPVSPVTQTNNMTFAPPAPEEALQLIQRIQDKRGAPLLTFVTVPEVTVRSDVVEQIYEQLRLIGHVPQIDLFLHSSGGQTEVPWRLITLIRDFADRFSVLIPGIAYSAATHLAMGADQIIMGPRSELSPVDPALLRANTAWVT